MDRETFSREVWALRAGMLRFAMSRLHRRQDAEDVVQDAVLAAWERLHTLRDEALFRTWMMSIVSNKCKMALRKRGRETLPGELPEQAVPRDREAEALWESVCALPDALRAPIVLHYYEGFKIEEVSAILRVRMGTVAARMGRARKRLKEELCQKGESK